MPKHYECEDCGETENFIMGMCVECFGDVVEIEDDEDPEGEPCQK